MITRIDLAKSLGKVLQGKLLGRKHYAQICGALAATTPGQMIGLDFQNVEIVTGSWANEMIVPFYKWAAATRIDLYPVLFNLRPSWTEELQLLAEWNQQCYVCAQGDSSRPRRAALVGPLDPWQLKTLAAVLKHREITGAELERNMPEERVGATAWNNRLRDLQTKRLLISTKRGRKQVYSPVMEEIVLNG